MLDYIHVVNDHTEYAALVELDLEAEVVDLAVLELV
jgi:hypothetical protein